MRRGPLQSCLTPLPEQVERLLGALNSSRPYWQVGFVPLGLHVNADSAPFNREERLPEEPGKLASQFWTQNGA